MSPDEKDPPLTVENVSRDDAQAIFKHDVINYRNLRRDNRPRPVFDLVLEKDSGGDDVDHEDHGA